MGLKSAYFASHSSADKITLRCDFRSDILALEINLEWKCLPRILLSHGLQISHKIYICKQCANMNI